METPMSKPIRLGVASWHYTIYPALALGYVCGCSSGLFFLWDGRLCPSFAGPRPTKSPPFNPACFLPYPRPAQVCVLHIFPNSSTRRGRRALPCALISTWVVVPPTPHPLDPPHRSVYPHVHPQAQQVVRLLCDDSYGKSKPDEFCREHEGGNGKVNLNSYVTRRGVVARSGNTRVCRQPPPPYICCLQRLPTSSGTTSSVHPVRLCGGVCVCVCAA
jgi:hypothetical protein